MGQECAVGILLREAEGCLTETQREKAIGGWSRTRFEDAGVNGWNDITMSLKIPIASRNWKRQEQIPS